MSIRSLGPFAASLAVLALATGAFGLTGCAADTSIDEEVAADGVDAEDVGTSEDALTGTAKRFQGTWSEGTATGSDFNMYYSKLVFGANGRYTGEIADPRIRCVRAPCVLQDSGSWNGYTYAGELRLRMTSTRLGRRVYNARILSAQASPGVIPPQRLILSRNGTTVNLSKERTVRCEVLDCNVGFRCEEGTATKNAQCVPTSTCANVRCTSSTHCEDNGGTTPPQCVPNATCAAMLCAPGTTCEENNGNARCVPQAACRKTGCSGHVCADSDMITTCEFRPEYACYRSATCERGADGQCGFRKTPALTSCLASPPGL